MRCQLSDEYFKHRNNFKYKKTRRGTIVRVDVKRDGYSVVWDGSVTPEKYHKDFIKIIT